MIRQHLLYRDAIIAHRTDSYPLLLFTFNEKLLNRKQSLTSYKTIADDCSLPQSVSYTFYDLNDNGIATTAQSFFSDHLIFFHSVNFSGLLLKTMAVSYGKKFADCCVSYNFGSQQQKFGLIRAIFMTKKNNVRILIEELIQKRKNSSKLKFKLNDQYVEIPNIFVLYRSDIYYIKHPKCIIKKHAMISRPANCVFVLEYPNIKDNS